MSLLCTLLISLMFSGVSLNYLHSAASEEGEIPSTVAANPPLMLLLDYSTLFHCCYLLLWSMRQYYCLISNKLSRLGLERWLVLQTLPVLGVTSVLQLLISGS